MIERVLQTKLLSLCRRFPAAVVTGPRQSGKTTLCRMAFPKKPYVSLEAFDLREYARTDPRGLLSTYRDGAILDEVQHVPELLSYLQTELDERPEPGRFILTGSANLGLMQSVSQSLAGRTAVLHLLPFGLDECRRFPGGAPDLFSALWTGGYPAIYDRHMTPAEWFQSYVSTYIERDVRQIVNVTDLNAFQTFVRLCAGRTAQLLNLSQLGADCGITHNTAKTWLSVLEACYITFRLTPWTKNLRKRLVKTPKLFFYDAGLVCYLLGIQSPRQLTNHPLRGAIFETWAVAELFKYHLHRGVSPRLYFYRDQKGLEVDCLLERGGDVIALEIKSGQTAAADFFSSLDRFATAMQASGNASPTTVLVYGGDRRFSRLETMVMPWSDLTDFNWITGAAEE